jgi:PadR family transcriptional regulator, regulatory protein AphA
MQEPRLTPTSYIVLGLLELGGEATPYELKQQVAASVGYFWSLHHAQLYTEPERLANAGYLDERREETGRRRKHYSVTAKGRDALATWRAEPTGSLTELREPALLKLFFGADPGQLAEVQVRAHRERLAEYRAIQAQMPEEVPPGPRLALEAGMEAERAFVRFWERVAGG